MNIPGGWELILVVLVIMVLFGAKRLPDSARALGRSMRILKAETKGLHDDDAATTTTTVTAQPLTTAPSAAPTPAPSPAPTPTANPTPPPSPAASSVPPAPPVHESEQVQHRQP